MRVCHLLHLSPEKIHLTEGHVLAGQCRLFFLSPLYLVFKQTEKFIYLTHTVCYIISCQDGERWHLHHCPGSLPHETCWSCNSTQYNTKHPQKTVNNHISVLMNMTESQRYNTQRELETDVVWLHVVVVGRITQCRHQTACGHRVRSTAALQITASTPRNAKWMTKTAWADMWVFVFNRFFVCIFCINEVAALLLYMLVGYWAGFCCFF